MAEAKLREAQKELEAGKDFAEVADTNSDCQDPGGDLGWFDRERMVAPFSEVAFSLPDSQISEPVLTQFGYHLIEITSRSE